MQRSHSLVAVVALALAFALATGVLKPALHSGDSDRMNPMRNEFVQRILGGLSLDEALRKTAETAASEVTQQVDAGMPVAQALQAIGVRGLPLRLPTDRGPGLEREVLKLIKEPELKNIPSAACMEAHLPKGRVPAAEDIERAWDICTSK
jgi:hypothetical protein